MIALKTALNSIYSLGDDLTDLLSAGFKTQIFPKKTFLAQAGFPSDVLLFIRKGLVREFYLHDAEDESSNDNEINSNFAGEGQFIFVTISFLTGEPSRRYLQTLEDTEVCMISRKEIQRLKSQNPEIANWLTALYESRMVNFEKVLRIIRTQSVTEGYEMFMKRHADIAHRISDKYIASYLNITPSSLSRIRAKIAKRQV